MDLQIAKAQLKDPPRVFWSWLSIEAGVLIAVVMAVLLGEL
jgi:hypothetical protein